MQPTDPPSRDTLALDALRECHAGRADHGVALYRAALRRPGGFRMKVGIHAAMLERAGRGDIAERLLLEGVRASADVTTTERGGDAAAIADYERCFARGLANAYMVANYTVCLSRAGAADKLAAITDPARLFRQTTLTADGPDDTFLTRVADALMQARGRAHQPAYRSVRNLDRVPRTHELDHPDLVALHRAVAREVGAYVTDVAASGHPVGAWLPRRLRLHSWGVVSNADGYNVPHIHLGCWLVAVVYIAADVPAVRGSGDGGLLRVGPSRAGDASCAGWPDLAVAPTPGSIVIMPAFYTHWTVPMQQPGLRISVACNVHDASDDPVDDEDHD
jgi:hypothetical protein